jgi:hypothetical protein
MRVPPLAKGVREAAELVGVEARRIGFGITPFASMVAGAVELAGVETLSFEGTEAADTFRVWRFDFLLTFGFLQ